MFYNKTTLENGVRILTEKVPAVRSVAIGVWVDVGSRDENEENSGISHFIEHMMFKGTTHRSAKQIAEELDAVGGQLNAFTTKEYTCYYAKTLDEHFDLALDLLSDMLFHSKFAQEDIDREKNVIIEEIKMYEDAPDELVHDLFAKTIWQDHALGKPIIGTTEIVSNMTREKIVDYMSRYYVPGRMVVSVAGNIDEAAVLERLKPVFGTLQGEDLINRKFIQPLASAQSDCRKKDTEQVHMVLGTPGLSLDHQDLYTVQVINTILGGGLSSRLFQEIREQRGLVYTVYSYHSSYHDSGLFGIYAGLSKKNVNQTMELILKEIKDIKQNGVTTEELKRAKDQLKGNLLLSLESVNTRMSRLGKSELYLGRVLSPEEIVDKVNQVTEEEIITVARALFKEAHFSLAAIGPWQDCGELTQLFNSCLGR